MTLKKPKHARGVMGVDPWEECKKISLEMYWGNPNGPPATKPTMFRGAVVVGCVLRQEPGIDGKLFLSTGGSWTIDDQEPEVARALAEQLRATADALEREAGS